MMKSKRQSIGKLIPFILQMHLMPKKMAKVITFLHCMVNTNSSYMLSIDANASMKQLGEYLFTLLGEWQSGSVDDVRQYLVANPPWQKPIVKPSAAAPAISVASSSPATSSASATFSSIASSSSTISLPPKSSETKAQSVASSSSGSANSGPVLVLFELEGTIIHYFNITHAPHGCD
jgi:hypothetical protein